MSTWWGIRLKLLKSSRNFRMKLKICMARRLKPCNLIVGANIWVTNLAIIWKVVELFHNLCRLEHLKGTGFPSDVIELCWTWFDQWWANRTYRYHFGVTQKNSSFHTKQGAVKIRRQDTIWDMDWQDSQFIFSKNLGLWSICQMTLVWQACTQIG